MLPRAAFAAMRDRASGSANDYCEVISCVMAGVDHGDTAGRSRAEQLVGWHLTGMGPSYGDLAAAHGFAESVAAVRAANPRPVRGSLYWPHEANELLDQLAVFGGRDDIRNGFEVWDELADVVAVGIGPGPVGDISALIEAAGPTRPASSPRPRISCANAAVNLHNTSRPPS
jgi:hypothetical protein